MPAVINFKLICSRKSGTSLATLLTSKTVSSTEKQGTAKRQLSRSSYILIYKGLKPLSNSKSQRLITYCERPAKCLQVLGHRQRAPDRKHIHHTLLLNRH